MQFFAFARSAFAIAEPDANNTDAAKTVPVNKENFIAFSKLKNDKLHFTTVHCHPDSAKHLLKQLT